MSKPARNESVVFFEIEGARVYMGVTLSKRDLFAAMAMQGIVAGADGVAYGGEVVRKAVRAADMLIAELNKDPEGA